MEDNIGIGFVGAGHMAAAHAAAVRARGGAQLVSVFDTRPDQAREFAASWGATGTAASLAELVSNDAVDAVIVCTPPAAHAEATIAALDAGKHVLCEKPFALDLDEAAAMVQAAERSSGFLACTSARLRCVPAHRAARAIIDTGELGEVYYARFSSWRLRGRPGHHFAPQSSWFLDRSLSGGGVLVDYGVYAIDSVLWMLGDPTVVSVTAQTRRFSEEEPVPAGVVHDVEDHAIVMLQCEGGRSALVEVAWVSNMTPPQSMVVLGTKAGLRFDPLSKISVRPVGADEYDPVRESLKAFGGEVVAYRAAEEQLFPHAQMAAANVHEVTTQFLEGISIGVQPQTSGHEALQITRIVDAAYRSAESGTGVALAEVSPLGV